MKPQNSSQKFRILGPENPKFKEDFLGNKIFQLSENLKIFWDRKQKMNNLFSVFEFRG